MLRVGAHLTERLAHLEFPGYVNNDKRRKCHCRPQQHKQVMNNVLTDIVRITYWTSFHNSRDQKQSTHVYKSKTGKCSYSLIQDNQHTMLSRYIANMAMYTTHMDTPKIQNDAFNIHTAWRLKCYNRSQVVETWSSTWL